MKCCDPRSVSHRIPLAPLLTRMGARRPGQGPWEHSDPCLTSVILVTACGPEGFGGGSLLTVRSWRGTARAVVRLPPRRWWAVVRTVVLAGLLEIGLRVTRLPRLARALGVRTEPFGPAATDARQDTHPDAMVPRFTRSERDRIDTVRRVLSHRPFNGTCLRQALLVGNALRARQPLLRVGVTKRDGAVVAHAWLELDGGVIDDFAYIPGGSQDFRVLSLHP